MAGPLEASSLEPEVRRSINDTLKRLAVTDAAYVAADAVVTAAFTAADTAEVAARNAAIATHESDTTSVHGIADTAALYRSGGTDVAVADGGTGSSTASGARTNLGVAIGSDVAAFNNYQGSLTKSAAQTLTTGTFTQLTFDTELFDYQGWHSTSSNTARITAPVACILTAHYTVEFVSNSTNRRWTTLIRYNSSSVSQESGGTQFHVANTGTHWASGSCTFLMAAGDYVILEAQQSSGGNLNVNSAKLMWTVDRLI